MEVRRPSEAGGFDTQLLNLPTEHSQSGEEIAWRLVIGIAECDNRDLKTVIFLAPARRALLKHKGEAARIITKIEDYAADPAAFPKVKMLKGGSGKRLRVGSFRVIFEETADAVIVTGVGPRGRIYE